MSTLKCVELYENTELVSDLDPEVKRIAKFVARHIANLKADYCLAHKVTVDVFCKRAGLTKKYLYELMNCEASPTVDKLNHMLLACDTNLAEFFDTIVTHAKLANIEAKSATDRAIIEVLASALSHPRARAVVEGAAAAVEGFLDRETTQ
jgi:transcriptional regulator with XRE-family HTH domain